MYTENKNAEPIENLLLNQFGITNKKPSETLCKIFAIKKEQTPEFFSESALKCLKNKKSPVQVPKTALGDPRFCE